MSKSKLAASSCGAINPMFSSSVGVVSKAIGAVVSKSKLAASSCNTSPVVSKSAKLSASSCTGKSAIFVGIGPWSIIVFKSSFIVSGLNITIFSLPPP